MTPVQYKALQGNADYLAVVCCRSLEKMLEMLNYNTIIRDVKRSSNIRTSKKIFDFQIPAGLNSNQLKSVNVPSVP